MRHSKDERYRARAATAEAQRALEIPTEREWVASRLVAARANFPAATTFAVLESHDLGEIQAALDESDVGYVLQQNRCGAGWHVTITGPRCK